MTRLTWFPIVVVALLLLHAPSVTAQTISGTVTDTSGAVMPGVTVDVASPALIEQTRTAVTNDAGRYSVVNLRPGTYSVTFTLTGFSTVKREGIVLTSDFTAQVNAQLAVGGVSEVVTVAGESPVVDVQGTAAPVVMTRTIMDALPTGRSQQAFALTIPGAGPGAFGAISYRGTTDAITTVDGMRTTFMVGAGPSNSSAAFSNAMYQEFSYSTAIDSAEMGQPGLRINLVPKDGGNQFRGSVFTIFTDDAWQASNLDDALRAQGITAQAKTLREWDVNPSFGGPLKRDALWFQVTARSNGGRSQVLDSFADKDPSPFRYEADLSKPAVDDNWGVSGGARLTWQASSRDKVAGFFDRAYSKVPHFRTPLVAVVPPPEATPELARPLTRNIGARWTRTQTSRLLFELGFSKFDVDVFNNYRGDVEAWSARHVDSGLPAEPPAAYAILEQTSNRQIGVSNISDGNVSRTATLTGAATFITGSHSLKSGFSFFRGSYHRPTSVVGYVAMTYINGVPNAATLTLPGNEREQIDGDWAFYTQDRWTIKRLTLNLGARLDWLRSSVPEQVLPASVWLPEATHFQSQDVLDWKDLSPRLGAAYDLFGNGKTAVKVALARYVAGETVSLTGQANPIRTIPTTDRRQWHDDNGDFTIFNADGSVQASELGPTSNANFGRAVQQTTFDPEVLGGWFNRGDSWETNVSVQHELLPRVAVTALYYRRTTGNQRVNDNVLIGPSDYTGPFCVTGPSDPRLPGGGGEQICGLYDITPAARPLTKNLNTFASSVGDRKGFKDITSGFEFTMNARLPKGAFVQGGVNLQKLFTNAQRGGGFGGAAFPSCSVIDNPEVRFCESESPYRPDIKLNGSYMLPYQVMVAATYQGLAGPEIQATWNAPNAVIAPALGRNLSAGATATKAISLIAPNSRYVDMRHQVDLRFSKGMTIGRYRIQINADVYNVFNSNAPTAVATTFPRDWLRTQGILAPRQFKLGAQVDF